MKRRPVILAILFILLPLGGLAYYLQRPKPLYCQVAFGPNASTRVWFTLHGDTIYLDQGGEDTPRKAICLGRSPVPESFELAGFDGQSRFTITQAHIMYIPQAVSPSQPQELYVEVSIDGPASFRQYASVRMAEQPSQAGLAHFDGPLSVKLTEGKDAQPLTIEAGKKPTDFRVVVGTFRPEVGCWAVVASNVAGAREVYAFPRGVNPVVDLEFPPKSPGTRAVKRRYTLNQFC